MVAIKRNDKVTLLQNLCSIWLKRTPEELQALRDADAAAGRFHDDAGEPILYGPYSGWTAIEVDTLEVTVTSLRPKWEHYTRRPKGLSLGWCESLQRDVLFATK
jgi:hypothetical protein